MLRLRLPLGSLLLAFTLLMARAEAQRGGDLQAQILYAFHAEDVNELTNLAQTLSTQLAADGSDAALRYHLAHADYRLGLLAVAPHARDAEGHFSACVDELKPLLAAQPESVEVLVLQSACYAHLARFQKFGAVLVRSRAVDRLNLALKLAPQNPRAVYVSAMQALAGPSGAADARVDAALLAAAQLFERSSATNPETPGWGHAEAYLELGRRLQARGDVLGARNWIEKSLIVAPDFKAARRQLATLVSH